MINLGNDWDELLSQQFLTPYYQALYKFLKTEFSQQTVYPEMTDIFNAFKLTSYKDCKVVIIGQDPYHEKGQANGLAFSVNKGVKLPPSLRNIYKEIESDLGIQMDYSNGDLTPWARQGVFLLNDVLTVRSGHAGSHSRHGWEMFTDDVVRLLNKREDPLVFVFWGNKAKSKISLINNPNHLVLKCAHPSPLSAYTGFFGCKHFSKINNFLEYNKKDPIDWKI